MSSRGNALLFIACATLSACSPFGRKSEPKELFPADSLSRSIAQAISPDTLILNYRMDGGEDSYFSSILFGSDTVVWVSDLGRHSIRRFTLGGAELDPITGFAFPYLVGERSDTVAVYDAGLNRLVSVFDTAFSLALPQVVSETAALARQVSILDGVAYLKDAAGPGAVLYRLTGPSVETVTALPGATWRHHGVLKPWRGKLASFSSYRPIVYTFDPTSGLDSMRLTGFDSPMLARGRAYSLGSIDEPPLMISGVHVAQDYLYVINVRPGILRLDVFDPNGRLVRVLQFEEPEPSGFTPVDLVVGSEGDSSYVIVASVSSVYGPLSLRYASRLDRFGFPSSGSD